VVIAIHKYWYWVLVSLEANIIGYWILGAFLRIVLTLYMSYLSKYLQCFDVIWCECESWRAFVS